MKKIVLIATGVLAAMALTAAPAMSAGHAAAGSAECTGWETDGAGAFDSLAAITSAASTARGAAGEGPKEPSLNETYEALPDTAKGKGGPNFRATVPTYIHVISPDGTTGNVSQRVIDEQMSVLNLAAAGFYGGAKTGFKFSLQGVTRSTNASWYNAGAGSFAERELKSTLHQGGWETLNVYTNLAGGYLGYAYLPGLPESRQYIDGVVLNWESMPGASSRFAGRYDLGHTLTHEVGHWIDLDHTFFGGCNAKGDFVDDTPAMLVPTNGCPIGKDTCEKKPGLDPIHNYMDYSYDSCYNQFTPGQAARAQDAWIYFRAA